MDKSIIWTDNRKSDISNCKLKMLSDSDKHEVWEYHFHNNTYICVFGNTKNYNMHKGSRFNGNNYNINRDVLMWNKDSIESIISELINKNADLAFSPAIHSGIFFTIRDEDITNNSYWCTKELFSLIEKAGLVCATRGAIDNYLKNYCYKTITVVSEIYAAIELNFYESVFGNEIY